MEHFFWIDLEMTGLDFNDDVILEAACVVTDLNFKTIHEYDQVVFQPPSELAKMDEWCQKTHGESGLTAKIKDGKPLSEVEDELLKIADRFFKPDEKVVLCGNSVYNDKLFIEAGMTRLAQRLHYRVIDVSSFKEIFKAKYQIDFEKQNTHRALDDIYESISELKAYLKLVKV